MDFLQELFEGNAITWEQFSEKVTQRGFKLADLSAGNYVGKAKYTNELATKDSVITDLQNQLNTRDADIKSLRDQLNDGSANNATKIAELTAQIDTLTNNYNAEKAGFAEKLQMQAYEFAVKEFANEKKFTSQAAKRDFVSEMLKAKLTLQGDKIMGAEDFVTSYASANEDAFLVEAPIDNKPNPTFVNPQAPKIDPATENAFLNAFSFNGVRPKN